MEKRTQPSTHSLLPSSSKDAQQKQRRAQPSAISSSPLSTALAVLLSLLLALGLLVSAFDSRLLTRWPHREQAAMHTRLDDIFRWLGPYAPYMSQRGGTSCDLPNGCEISQITILQRHGARYPTAGAQSLVEAALARLKRVNASDLPSHSLLKFIEDYSFESKPDTLTDYGRKEAYDAGAFFSKLYASFEDKEGVWIRSSGQDRVVESARFFYQGFRGEPFVLGNLSSLPEVDMSISEEDGFNNPLSVYTCSGDNKLDPHPGKIAERDWLAIFAPPIADRLNVQLPGANLSPTNILSLMSLCGFDSLRNVKLERSPWCDVFTLEEWKQNEYYYDVSKYYYHGFGSPFGRAKGASYVNELVARLIDSKHVVQAGSSNMSLIGPPGGERVFVDFSHDNTMVEILTALEMMKNPTPLPTQPSLPPPPHIFEVSKIVPFSGRFVFERIECSSRRVSVAAKRRTFVRTLINDAIRTTPDFPTGLVPLSHFLETVSFAQGGGDWSKCDVGLV